MTYVQALGLKVIGPLVVAVSNSPTSDRQGFVCRAYRARLGTEPIPLREILQEAPAKRWLHLLEAHDADVYRHSLRVAALCAEDVRSLRLPQEVQRWLIQAALLHDVGKLWTPLAVLRKPGALSSTEI